MKIISIFCLKTIPLRKSGAHLHRGKAIAETPSNSGLIVFLCLRFICKEHFAHMNHLKQICAKNTSDKLFANITADLIVTLDEGHIVKESFCK